jgi:hypothetical protein
MSGIHIVTLTPCLIDNPGVGNFKHDIVLYYTHERQFCMSDACILLTRHVFEMNGIHFAMMTPCLVGNNIVDHCMFVRHDTHKTLLLDVHMCTLYTPYVSWWQS